MTIIPADGWPERSKHYPSAEDGVLTRRIVTVAGAALAAWSAWLLQPWRFSPFDRLDFPDIIPVLQQSGSVLDGAWALHQFYLDFGRFFPMHAFSLSLHWEAFGSNPVGWQVARFVLMWS